MGQTVTHSSTEPAGFARTRSGLLVPTAYARRQRRPNIVAVIYRADGTIRRIIPAKNIVTDAGAIWYAQKATGETVTNNFTNMVVGTGNGGAWGASSVYSNLTGAIGGSNKGADATYPKRNDGDAANTGAGTKVMTWRWSYTSSDFTSASAVTDAVITIAAPIAGSALLTGFTFGSNFTLAAGESVKIFVNHTLTPV
jgi:hypothetical protein